MYDTNQVTRINAKGVLNSRSSSVTTTRDQLHDNIVDLRTLGSCAIVSYLDRADSYDWLCGGNNRETEEKLALKKS